MFRTYQTWHSGALEYYSNQLVLQFRLLKRPTLVYMRMGGLILVNCFNYLQIKQQLLLISVVLSTV